MRLLASAVAVIVLVVTLSAAHEIECDESALHCFDATCGLGHPPDVLDACECTFEDYGYQYGHCEDDNTRHIVFYRRPPATCRGGIDMPTPLGGIPCNLVCYGGTYLDLQGAKPECRNCSVGSYAAGGGVLYEGPWNVMPLQFSASCIGPTNRVCNPWRPVGAYLDSGNNFGTGNMQSILEVSFTLARNGYIQFVFKVSTELDYDKFTVTDNGLQILSRSGSTNWIRYLRRLSSGHHVYRFMYTKDALFTGGQDRVYLRELEIGGMTLGDLECLPCPAGTYSGVGALDCYDCPANTFSPAPGTPCEPCKPSEYSFPGATQCIPNAPCDENDLGVTYGPCVNGEQTVTYAWLEPRECDFNSNFTMPDPTTRACTPQPCAPGYESIAGACAPCMLGSSSPGGFSQCSHCSDGSETSMHYHVVDEWSESVLSTWVQSSCEGDCGSSTWRYGGSFVDSGANHGPDTDVSLTFTVPFEGVGANVSFAYTLSCAAYSGGLELLVNDVIVWGRPCRTSCDQSVQYYNQYIDPALFNGTYATVTFVYRKQTEGNDDNSCDVVKLYSVVFSGVTDQPPFKGYGGSQCRTCDAGSFSMEGNDCALCAMGFFSGPHARACSACIGNTVSYADGMANCVPCGAGTTANRLKTGCTFNCSVTVPGANGDPARVDLSRLSDQTGSVGPIASIAARNFSFWLSLCDYIPTDHPCGNLNKDGWTDINPSTVVGLDYVTPRARKVESAESEEDLEAALMRHVIADRRGVVSLKMAMGVEASAPARNKYGAAVPRVREVMRTLAVGQKVTIPGFACMVDHYNNKAMNTGSVVSVVIPNSPPSDNGVATTVQLQFNYGSTTPECLQYGHTTTVDLKCDPNEGIGWPMETTQRNGDPCKHTFDWATRYACRLCTSDDYHIVPSPCRGAADGSGQMTFTPYWNYPKTCQGGVLLPATTTSTCNPDLTYGSQQVAVTRPMFGITIGIMVVILIAGLGVILYQWRRHKQVYSMYSTLRTNEASGGLAFEDDDAPDVPGTGEPVGRSPQSAPEEIDENDEQVLMTGPSSTTPETTTATTHSPAKASPKANRKSSPAPHAIAPPKDSAKKESFGDFGGEDGAKPEDFGAI